LRASLFHACARAASALPHRPALREIERLIAGRRGGRRAAKTGAPRQRIWANDYMYFCFLSNKYTRRPSVSPYGDNLEHPAWVRWRAKNKHMWVSKRREVEADGVTLARDAKGRLRPSGPWLHPDGRRYVPAQIIIEG
jgi:hypothetical protein